MNLIGLVGVFQDRSESEWDFFCCIRRRLALLLIDYNANGVTVGAFP